MDRKTGRPEVSMLELIVGLELLPAVTAPGMQEKIRENKQGMRTCSHKTEHHGLSAISVGSLFQRSPSGQQNGNRLRYF
ncbi:hypothetical protein AOLI_G00010290 [Acnodon oligacanthus]